MALANTIANFDAFMKELYEDGEPYDIAKKNHPTMKIIKKKGGFIGEYKVVPVAYGAPAGRSRTFSKAQANAGASKKKKFNIPAVDDFLITTISSKLLKAAAGDLGAFAESRKWEVDQMLKEMGANMSRSLFKDGKGLLGQAITVSAATDGTVTVNDASIIRALNIGAKIGAVLTPYGTPTERSGTATIATIDREGLSFTFTGTITGFVANDYFFYDGDYSTASDIAITGFLGYVPWDNRTSTLFGMVRSDDVDRLSGIKHDDPTAPIVQTVGLLADKVHAQGGSPKYAVVNHLKFREACWELGTKVEYDPGSEATYGIRGIKVPYAEGTVTLYGDPDCPANRGWVYDPEVWTLRYMGDDLIHLVDDDGMIAVRSTTEDGIEIRSRTYSQLECKAPGYNGIFSVA